MCPIHQLLEERKLYHKLEHAEFMKNILKIRQNNEEFHLMS